jgi:hypothetical protein
MSAYPIVEDNGRLLLPLAGAAVVQCCVDFAVTLRCDVAGAAFEVRIEQAFTFTTADGAEARLVPEDDPTGLGPVLACTRTTVVQATAFEDGGLAMVLADGSTIKVPPGDAYESWSLVGPAGLRVVSGPGGRLTTWRPDEVWQPDEFAD